MTITLKSSYMRTALKPKELKLRAKTALAGVQFDTVVGTGLSGVLPLHTLAEQFKVYPLAVRKPGERSHSGSRLLQGTLGDRWLFVDDFVSSGDTFTRVFDAIKREVGYKPAIKCVGAFLYDEDPGKRWTPFLDIPKRAVSSFYDDLMATCRRQKED